MTIEIPKYHVRIASGNFEIRRYESIIVAEVFVNGTLQNATRAGFRLVADYIFGNNHSVKGTQMKVKMTAPVTIEPIKSNTPLFVSKAFNDDSSSIEWRLHFVMPRELSLDDLPQPSNPEVRLRIIPQREVAVFRFSGIATPKKTQKAIRKLSEWMSSKGLHSTHPPELARYNPPWTIPFFRRNEVMFELDQ